MSDTHSIEGLKVRSIFHPSDFSEASEIAFAHALKIALLTRADLNVLHATSNANLPWQNFPAIRNTLVRWNLIPEASPESAVGKLGIDVRKVISSSDDPVEASLDFLGKHPADMVVLAVHRNEGRMRWMDSSVGKPIARAVGEMTLFIPHGVEGFVSRKDGSVSLRNILIPVTDSPLPRPAVETAARLIRNLALPAGTVTVLHAGAAGDAPSVPIPTDTGWTWNRVSMPGEPVDAILQTAIETSADLIVMTSEGPDGFLDALRGSTSERVLRKTLCPVINLPVGARHG